MYQMYQVPGYVQYTLGSERGVVVVADCKAYKNGNTSQSHREKKRTEPRAYFRVAGI